MKIQRIFLEKKFIRKIYPNLKESILKHFFENYGYTMPISLLDKLDKITKKLKPELVFEFGSGVSTILLSSNLKESRGEIFTFDEDLKWIEDTYKKGGEMNNVVFIFSPSEKKINYLTLIKNINLTKKVDLLIIDGPSGDRFTEQAKQLYDKLISPETICVIDDTDREINDIEAQNLAKKYNLRKVDYKDPLYKKHKYSILFPKTIDDKSLFD